MSGSDYYNVLGIDKGASEGDIKKAYRKLAMQYHPDKNPGDKASEAKFKEVSQAYEILKNSEKRSNYDNYGSRDGKPAGFGGGGGGFENSGDMNFNDIFSDFFSEAGGRGGGGSRAKKADNGGSDLRYNIEIPLEDAFHGSTQEISFSVNQSCTKCDSTGSSKGTRAQKCGSCRGSGRVRAQQGFFVVEQTCANCKGSGEVIPDPCSKCFGSGRHDKNKKLQVKIPKGVDNGTRIRLEGEGEAGIRGGRTGDLYIFVNILTHKFFERDGSSIKCEVPIKFTTAILGGSVEIPTIANEKVELKIPAGTQSGSTFRLKNEGLPIMSSALKGDMYIKVNIEIPDKLSSKQKELLKELDEDLTLSPKAESVFNKFKDFFK